MRKEDIIRDERFRQKCNLYGLSWDDFSLGHQEIYVNNSTNNMCVLLNNNYNTINVFDWDKDFWSCSDEKMMYNYCKVHGIIPLSEWSCYPIQKFTLKQIIKLSNITEILESTDNQIISMKINGSLYNIQQDKNDKTIQLLSYIKFLGDELELYFTTSYHFQSIGLEVPDVYSYLEILINKINNYIKSNNQVLPNDILEHIGRNGMNIHTSAILSNVIDLIKNEKKVEDESDDLTVATNNLLKILDKSADEINNYKKNNNPLSTADNYDSFKSTDEKRVVLTKVKNK